MSAVWTGDKTGWVPRAEYYDMQEQKAASKASRKSGKPKASKTGWGTFLRLIGRRGWPETLVAEGRVTATQIGFNGVPISTSVTVPLNCTLCGARDTYTLANWAQEMLNRGSVFIGCTSCNESFRVRVFGDSRDSFPMSMEKHADGYVDSVVGAARGTRGTHSGGP